ncbi:MAG: hypothetical protein AB7E48_01770 [Deferribacterales bacterium]
MENIKFVKLVSGDTCIGIKDDEKNILKDVAVVQAVPMGGSGIQIAILPFGFPYEDEIGGEIGWDKVMYVYAEFPEDIKNKYIEAKSGIRMAGGMGGLGGAAPKGRSDSGIII